MLIIQTASGQTYERMIQSTMERHQKFANLHGASRHVFFGIKRGFYDWHSAYNRIVMIKDLYVQGLRGWILYLDADAFVNDLTFDVQNFLAGMKQYLVVAAPGAQSGAWDINNGVFFLNLDHENAEAFVMRWYADFISLVSEADLRVARLPWASLPSGKHLIDDQTLMQNILKEPPFIDSICLVQDDRLNYTNGRFIRQIIRDTGLSPEERLSYIRGALIEEQALINSDDVINGLFKILLGREPDPSSFLYLKNELRNARQLENMIGGIAGSVEFKIRQPFFNELSQFGEIGSIVSDIFRRSIEHAIVVEVGVRGRERSNSYDLLSRFQWRGLLMSDNPNLRDVILREFEGLDFALANNVVSDCGGLTSSAIGSKDDYLSISSVEADPHLSTYKAHGDDEFLRGDLEKHKIPFNFGLLSLNVGATNALVFNTLVKASNYRPQWVIIAQGEALHGASFDPLVNDLYEAIASTGSNMILRRKQ